MYTASARLLLFRSSRGGGCMSEYREEQVVETTPGTRVVRETVDPVVDPTVIVEEPPRRVVRRWWRREPEPTNVVATEYYTAPAYAYDPALAQFLRVMWFLIGLLEALFALRFMLALMAANPANAFAALIYGVTG